MHGDVNPIGIYYEHPRWFGPVFAELDRRGVPYVRLDAARHHFDLLPNGNQPYGLIFNRMSPSAWTRGNAHAIFYTINYLAHLERLGTRVVNGSQAFRNETSKALQLSLLQSLGLPYPRSAVMNHSSEAPAACLLYTSRTATRDSKRNSLPVRRAARAAYSPASPDNFGTRPRSASRL